MLTLVSQAYSLVLQEEKQREISSNSTLSLDSSTMLSHQRFSEIPLDRQEMVQDMEMHTVTLLEDISMSIDMVMLLGKAGFVVHIAKYKVT